MDGDKDFWGKHIEFLERVIKLKKKMLEKGLQRARATCVAPCEGFIMAALAPNNKHIRAHCTVCKRQMME